MMGLDPANGTGPLAGLRVIDLTAMVMGPYCTQIMADMGADVIKVEPPEGDTTRYISVGPAPGMSGVFREREPRQAQPSVLGPAKPRKGKVGPACALRGCGRLQSTRCVFKAIAKLGFAYEDLAANQTQRSVYTNCYGYSRRGPDGDLPAYDDTIQGRVRLDGPCSRCSTGEASYVGTIMADKVTGLTALYATMMATVHRERDGGGPRGRGRQCFETMASFMLVEHANGALFTPRLGPAALTHARSRPNRRPYRTSDGYISALILQRQALELVRRRGAPALGRPTKLATVEQRAPKIDAVYGPPGGHVQGANDRGVAGAAFAS